MGVAKHSWLSWLRPLPLCPYEAFSKVGDYAILYLQYYKNEALKCKPSAHTVKFVALQILKSQLTAAQATVKTVNSEAQVSAGV